MSIEIRPDKCYAMYVANKILIDWVSKLGTPSKVLQEVAGDFNRVATMLYRRKVPKKDGKFNVLESKFACQLVSIAINLSSVTATIIMNTDPEEQENAKCLHVASVITIIDCVPALGTPPGMVADEFWATAKRLREELAQVDIALDL